MTHHNVPFRRQCRRDAAQWLAEVPPWAWGLLALTALSAFVAVLGVGMISGGSHVGVFVLLGGAAVVTTTVAYWVEGLNGGLREPKRIQTTRELEYVSHRMGSAVPRGLLGMPSADGPQTEGFGEPGPGSMVRPVGRHRAVYRVLGTQDPYRIMHCQPRATATSSAETTHDGPGKVASVA